MNRQSQQRRRNPNANLRHNPRYQPPRAQTSVPSTEQVVRGALVSIVLKEDQPTGREVQGTVQDILTRGNHPRGIKVRLLDGRVGRVQRTVDQHKDAFGAQVQQESTALPSRQPVHSLWPDQSQEEPPPRTLADYLPSFEDRDADSSITDQATFSTTTAKCPVCGIFEGDETAVSHHVQEHFK